MVWASLRSCVAWPPWMAFMERAWPRTTGIRSRAHEVSQPVPREETFHADDEGRLIRSDGLEERFGSRLHLPVVQHDLPVLIQETEVHGAGVQVDATSKTCAAWWRIA